MGVLRSDADKVPFILKKDLNGNVQKIRATGLRGGEIQGSIQQTKDGLSFLVAGDNVTILSQSNGQVVISSTGGGGGGAPSGPAGGDLGGNYPNPTVVGLSIVASNGDILYYNGGWQRLAVGSNGQVLTAQSSVPTWQTPASSKLFDNFASYVVLGLTSSLANERVLAPGSGLTLDDAGPNANVTLAVDGTVARISGSHFSGNVTVVGTGSFELGVSGSLTRLVDGRSYLMGLGSVFVTSASNGQVTVSGSGITALQAGDGIFVVPGSQPQVNVDGTVARISGSHFTGGITVVGTGSFELGMSGSLTRLTSGQSYLAAQGSITIFSSSNGQVIVSGSGITTLQAGDGVTIVPGSQPQVNVDGTVARISGSHFTGGITVVGTGSFELGISGSLTRLTSGQSYLAAQGSVAVISSSNGQVIVSGSGVTTLQAGDGIFVVPGSQPQVNVDGTVARISGSHFTGGITVVGTGSFELGMSGSLTRLTNGLSYLVGLGSVFVTSASNGQVTVSGSGITALQAGDGIFVVPGSQPQVNVDGTVARISGSHFTGGITVVGTGSFESGISGSLTRLTNGLSYLVGLGSVAVISSSNGQVIVSGSGVTTLQAGDGVTIAPGSQPQVNVDGTVARISGSHFTGGITVVGTGSFELGISGSLTTLIDGRSYLVAGSNITIVSTSNGQVLISSTATGGNSGPTFDATASYVVMGLTSSLASERVLTSSTGITITDGGANGNVTIGFKDSVLATISGSRFVGSIETTGTGSFDLGISGSLTRLTNGQTFLAAGTNILITSTSNGQVVISTNATINAQTAYNIFCSPMQVSGTTETVVASVYISAATFTTCRAMLGSQFSNDSSTLRFRRFSTGDIVLTLTGSGLLANVNSTGSLVIPADDWYNLSIFNSSVTGSAICQGMKIIV